MNDKTMTYKGYIGSVEYDIEDEILFGKILYVNDTVTFESTTIGGLKKEFTAAVDDYLVTCEQIGKEPQKSFKGSLNIRLGESLHRKAAIAAAKQDITLNDYIKNAVAVTLNQEKDVAVIQRFEFTENTENHYVKNPAAISEEAVCPGEKEFDFSFSRIDNDLSTIQ